MGKKRIEVPEGYKVIFRQSFTRGTKVYYSHKPIPMVVPIDKKNSDIE